MKQLISLIFATILFATVSFEQRTYTIDKYHSRLGFSATHFGISHVEGNFKTFDATLQANKEDLSDAVITLNADVNSINTEVEYRDNDLKSPNYFDAAKFPTLTFRSTSFKKVNGKNYELSGNMTIHGVTKPVVFNVVFNGTAITAMKKPTAGFTITGLLNRLDYGIGSSPLTSGVSNEIELRSNVEFTISN
ncbi:MAG: YceI family protein [Flavisolibacter sp.]